MKIKKRKANLIPYCREGGVIRVFLSRRSKNAKQLPDYFGFWGGGIKEGESPEKAMLRELQEELEYQPRSYEFLGVYYDFIPNEKHIFYAEVPADFEQRLKIHEGQYGKFFKREEILVEPWLVEDDKKII